MGHAHTPNGDTFHASFTQIDDGDAPTAANLNVPTETATDNAAWLKRRALVLADHDVDGDSELTFPWASVAMNVSARFVYQPDFTWLQTSVADSGQIAFEMQAPVFKDALGTPKCYVSDWGVSLRGGAGAGHGATMPATKPTVLLKAIDYTGAVTAIDGPLTEPPGMTAAQYDAQHEIGFSGLGANVDVTGKRIVLVITGETGANSVASTLKLFGAKVLFCCTP